MQKQLSAQIPSELAGQRLDQALAVLFADITRSQMQLWIKDGRVTLNGHAPRKRDKVKAGDRVVIRVPPPVDAGWRAQAIPLEIVYEDGELLVINKPPGLVVHPGAGNPEGTLLNALLNHAPKLAALPRAGIVHRLDKDTSGLMVVAQTERARQLNLISPCRKDRRTIWTWKKNSRRRFPPNWPASGSIRPWRCCLRTSRAHRCSFGSRTVV